MRSRRHNLSSAMLIAAIASGAFSPARPARADHDLSAARVKDSIRAVQQFLIRVQNPEGSYGIGVGGHTSGATSLAMLALLTSGVSTDEPAVARGLKFLRRIPDPQSTYATYQLS